MTGYLAIHPRDQRALLGRAARQRQALEPFRREAGLETCAAKA